MRGPEMTMRPSRDFLLEMADFYGERAEQSEVWDAISIRQYWLDEWRQRIADNWDCALLITGQPGVGKSSLGLIIASELDPTFDESHVAYNAKDFIEMIQRLGKGQAVLYDEAVVGTLASDTFSKEQKALVQALNIVRAKGLILILCIPEIFEVAKSYRARRAQYWLTCVERGIAWVHVRDYRIRYKPDQTLGLFIDREHGPYTWDSLDGTELWNRYHEHKMRNIGAILSEQVESLSNRRSRRSEN